MARRWADGDRLRQQLEFVLEIDRLKQVMRRTLLVDGARYENSAEHSWHLGVMALLLAEYAPTDLDLLRVLQMVLVHDIVEIDAGDTYCYEADPRDQAEREQRAAERLFGLLPTDQRVELEEAWREFEARETPESRFAAALDRLQPLMHNVATRGRTWQDNGIGRDQVIERCSPIGDGAPDLWREAERWIEEAAREGLLRGDEEV